jgi:hypothetical protein
MTDARPWSKEGTDYRCLRHGVVFTPPATCAQCMSDPGPALDDEIDEPMDPPPKGCASLEAHEREFTKIASFAEKQARELVKVGLGTLSQNCAAKWIDTAVKARRAAADLAARREDEESVRKREKRIVARSRGAH